MNKFEKALLGGIAGGAKASGEFFANRSKSKESQRKETVIAKRQETLAELKNKFAVVREQTQYDYKDRVRAEEQVTANLARPSGQVISGRSQTRGDMATMSDDDIKKSGAMSQEDYLNSKRDEKRSYDKTIADKKQEDAIALAEKRNERYDGKYNSGKPLTVREKNYLKENSINTLRADFSAVGGYYSKDANTIDFSAATADPEMIKELFSRVKKAGFTPTMDEDPKSKMIIINLGGFRAKEYLNSINSPMTLPTVPEVKDLNGDIFSQLDEWKAANLNKENSIAKSTAAGSNLNSEQQNFETRRGPGSSVGLAAPATVSTINPALPKDPKQWDVKQFPAGQQKAPVAIVNGEEIILTEEELQRYFASKRNTNADTIYKGINQGFTWAGKKMQEK